MFRDISVVPEVIAVKAEHLTYTISKTEPFWVMAFDTDGFCFPLLTVHWHNFSDSFVVTVTE